MLKTDHQDIARSVLSTKIVVSFRAATRNVTAGFLALAIVFLGCSYEGPGWVFSFTSSGLLWAGVMLLSLLRSVQLSTRFNRRTHSYEETVRQGKVNILNGALAGAGWGASAWLMVPGPLMREAFLVMSMAMVLTGGAGAQAVYRPLVLSYSLALTIFFVSGLVRLGDPFHLLIAAGFVTYATVVILFARDLENAVTTAIRLSFKNEELLAQRTQQQQAAERAQADAEVAREEAEKADRSKTNFIAAASHDLRQPMHALVQYVAHLRRTCNDALAQDTIDKIDDSVMAMGDLLNAVLDFSKISMGVIKPQNELVSLKELFERIDTQMRPLAEAKGLVFQIEPADICIESDDVLIERIVRNIAQNAVRYTDQGRIRIRAHQCRGLAWILIADSGIGIAAQQKSRIFEEYYQVDNPARDRRKGLGLGLAIVRDLAGLLGLQVKVKSIVGKGAVFALSAPTVDPCPRLQNGSTQVPEQDHVRGAFVVLIDDDELSREGLATTLRDFGCRVQAFVSALDALHALRGAEFMPQLVISDYRLGNGVTGLDAIRQVVDNQLALYGDAFHLPALLISGDTSPEELAVVSKAGYPMLHKPVAPGNLHDRMNTILRALVMEADDGSTVQ